MIDRRQWVLLAALFFAASACRSEPADAPTAGTAAPSDAARQRATVVRVIDGDTILVDLGGRRERVRYIGVDTPETVAPNQPVECFGKEAAAANEDLVDGETVRLVFDAERRDRYGRLLAYVYADGTFVNARLVEAGYATTLEIEPNTSRAGRLGRLEAAAGREGAGLWGAC